MDLGVCVLLISGVVIGVIIIWRVIRARHIMLALHASSNPNPFITTRNNLGKELPIFQLILDIAILVMAKQGYFTGGAWESYKNFRERNLQFSDEALKYLCVYDNHIKYESTMIDIVNHQRIMSRPNSYYERLVS